jgi:isovaleryl-CoA dehydrogenase
MRRTVQLSSRVVAPAGLRTSNVATGVKPLLRATSAAAQARSYSVSANLKDTVAEGLFDDTQKELKETVHQFAQREIAPLAAELDRKNEFPMVPPPPPSSLPRLNQCSH